MVGTDFFTETQADRLHNDHKICINSSSSKSNAKWDNEMTKARRLRV